MILTEILQKRTNEFLTPNTLPVESSKDEVTKCLYSCVASNLIIIITSVCFRVLNIDIFLSTVVCFIVILLYILSYRRLILPMLNKLF